MCGFLGIINKPGATYNANLMRFLQQGSFILGLRGQHGTGVFYKKDNIPFFIKRNQEITEFSGSPAFHDIIKDYEKTDFTIIHSRNITSGNRTWEATHPYVQQNIILAHNGSIIGVNGKYYSSVSVKEKGYSDSHWLSMELDKEAPKDYSKFFSTISGKFVVIWYNKSTGSLFIARNKDKELFFMELEDNYIICSEKEMLEFVYNRVSTEAILPKILSIEPLPVNTIREIKSDASFIDSTFEEKPVYPITPVPTYSSYDKTNWYTPNKQMSVGQKIDMYADNIFPYSNKNNKVTHYEISCSINGRTIIGVTRNRPNLREHLTGVVAKIEENKVYLKKVRTKQEEHSATVHTMPNIKCDACRKQGASWHSVFMSCLCDECLKDYTGYN